MTLVASSPKVQRAFPAQPARPAMSQRFLSAWQLLPAMLIALIGFLALTPDGIAEPMQDFAGWLVIGGVASLAVMAVVTGLDRLLDCEGN